MCVCVLVPVCNYRFVIVYIANHAKPNVECKAVTFDMTKLFGEHLPNNDTSRRLKMLAHVRACVCVRVCAHACVLCVITGL